MAATLFVLMGEEPASEVLKYLNESEIETISREISNVGPLHSEEAEKTAEELYGILLANRYVSDGGMDYAKKVIMRTLGAGQARRILDRLSQTIVTSTAFESIS